MRTILTILLALLVGGGGTYAWSYYGGFSGEKQTAIAFVDSYGAYVEVAREVETLVHTPGASGNADRGELEALLTTILTTDVDAERRDTLARLAYTHLDGIKHDVDAAQSAQARVYERLQDLDNAARVFRGVQVRERAERVVELARTQAERSARITSILSETNDQTYTIITRILADKGMLTDEHKLLINDTTLRAEQRHAQLTELYAALGVGSEELDRAFKALVDAAL